MIAKGGGGVKGEGEGGMSLIKTPHNIIESSNWRLFKNITNFNPKTLYFFKSEGIERTVMVGLMASSKSESLI